MPIGFSVVTVSRVAAVHGRQCQCIAERQSRCQCIDVTYRGIVIVRAPDALGATDNLLLLGLARPERQAWGTRAA